MRRTHVPLAAILAGLLGILVAAPAAGATTGTLCGEVTAYTAPTVATDGSITIDGTVEVIDSSAFGAIDAATSTTLTTVAAADATTCLEITADGSGAIIALDIAAQAQICGDVSFDIAADAYTVAGVEIPAAIVDADADLEAWLDLAAAGSASVCVDVTIDGTSGLITTVRLSATLDVCGDVALDADSATIGAVDIPLGLLDADAEAVLALAVDAGVNACARIAVDDTDLVEANVSASIDVCGAVTLDADGDATVGGAEIDATLLNAQASALLALAAEADGTACAAVDASSSGGTTSVGVTVQIEVCAEVTAVSDGTVTLGDVTFVYAGAADAGIAVGDVLCVAATTSPTGDPVITDPDTTDGDDGVGPAGGNGGQLLPDTALAAPGPKRGAASGLWLVALGGLWIALARRWRSAD